MEERIMPHGLRTRWEDRYMEAGKLFFEEKYLAARNKYEICFDEASRYDLEGNMEERAKRGIADCNQKLNERVAGK